MWITDRLHNLRNALICGVNLRISRLFAYE